MLPAHFSGYVIFLDSLRCRDLTAAQLDTKDREYLDKSAPGGGFLAQKLCQEPLLAEEAPPGASSGQLT